MMMLNKTTAKWIFTVVITSILEVSCFAVPENTSMAGASTIAAAKNVSLTIHADKTIGTVDERIYGQFLEHIYRSCSNGIWGEIVWNRSFEEQLGFEGWVAKEGCLVSPKDYPSELRFLLGTHWTDCEASVEFMRLAGKGETLIGVNCNSGNNYLVVLGANGQHRLELAINVPVHEGKIVQTVERESIQEGPWIKVRLRREKRRFQAWIDDQPLFDFTNDKDGPINGGVCLGVRNSQAQFRNLKVIDLTQTSFSTFDLSGVKAADLYEQSSLGQSLRVERPGLNQIAIAVACWKGVSDKGFKLVAHLDDPKGRLIASRQVPSGLREGDLASLDIPESLPIGTMLYVKMIPEASTKQNIIGWWSKDEDLYTPGKAYVNDQPVSGDRYVKLSYINQDAPDGTTLFEGLPFISRHWYPVGEGEISLDRDRPLNGASSVKIVSQSGQTGLIQNNYSVRKGDKLRGSLWTRGDTQEGLIVRLMDGSRVLDESTLTVKTGEWKEYPLLLESNITADTASLHILTQGKASVWIDQVSLMPDSARDTGGFRPDLLKAIADSRPPTIRWPGGSFHWGYQWKNGIGPQHKRIGKPGWDEFDTLCLGTDEFIQLCRKVGAEPIIVVYVGPGDRPENFGPFIQDVCDWVEYCNGPATSKWGSVRASNGHPEPYGVKYWEFGNELWSLTREQYGDVIRAFAPAVKKIDPTVKLIGCGGTFGEIGAGNDLAVIEDCAHLVDFVSIHHYEDPSRFREGVIAFDEHITSLGQRIAKSSNPGLKVYVSEWSTLNCQDWRGGLYAGGILTAFERNQYAAMACPALWLRHLSARDWRNASVNFDHRGWYPAPIYTVMNLFRDSYAPNQLEITGDRKGLSVIATMSDDKKRIYLKVVNALDKVVDVDLAIKGGFEVSGVNMKLIAPDSLKAQNSLENPDLVKVFDGDIRTKGGKNLFTLPRWSVCKVEMIRQ